MSKKLRLMIEKKTESCYRRIIQQILTNSASTCGMHGAVGMNIRKKIFIFAVNVRNMFDRHNNFISRTMHMPAVRLWK